MASSMLIVAGIPLSFPLYYEVYEVFVSHTLLKTKMELKYDNKFHVVNTRIHGPFEIKNGLTFVNFEKICLTFLNFDQLFGKF